MTTNLEDVRRRWTTPAEGLIRSYWVYLLECRDGTLYCGIATDPEKRLATHNSGRGSKYVRARMPARILAVSQPMTLAAAAALEYRIKRLSRAEKLRLVNE